MTTYTKIFQTLMLASAMLALFVGAQLTVPATADAQTPDTVTVHLEKKFSGPVPEGYTPGLFSFKVSGPSFPEESVTLIDENNGTADGFIDLPVGTYTVEEVGPTGFVAGEWRPGWYGDSECDSGSDFSTTLTIATGTLDHGTINCQVDNQWRYGTLRVVKEFSGTTTAPYEDFEFKVTQGATERFDGAFESDGDNEIVIAEGEYAVEETVHSGYTATYSEGCSGTLAFEDTATCIVTNTYTGGNGGGDGDGDTGTLVVKKIVSGGTAATSSFSFMVNGGSATSFESDGENIFTGMATGTYSVSEASASGYTASYDNCTSVSVTAGATTTCTITNTYSNGGGNGGDEDEYLVYGFVWHDRNENDDWENWHKGEQTPEEGESDLDGWTVGITNGSTTYATTTDSSGYYYFYVPAGTWTINETIQSGWSKTYPNDNGHVVVVGEVTLEEDNNFFAMIMDYLLPTAHAAVSLTTYGPFNFGNVYFGQGGGDGGNGSNGGGGSSGSIGGKITSSSVGEVLGAQVDVVPVLAANAGFGGASNAFSTDVLVLLSFLAALAIFAATRRVTHVQ